VARDGRPTAALLPLSADHRLTALHAAHGHAVVDLSAQTRPRALWRLALRPTATVVGASRLEAALLGRLGIRSLPALP
jgi:antitoxin (DNA-binding transcriptional repressor) of toxin-antitoxin stability system